MNSQEKWPILHMVEIETIRATGEIECTDERTLIGEDGPIDEIHSLGVF